MHFGDFYTISSSGMCLFLSDSSPYAATPKKAYRRNGVREYIVWQMFENKVNWFVLENDEYVNLTPDATGIIRSRVFPELWLKVAALLSGDMPTVLSVLQTGLDSTEHQEFVQKLAMGEQQ